MYKILIVDDEIAEREGIKFLISDYNLPLDVIEAKNGDEAWVYLQNNKVDIIFTDIKMPFMDGLELTSNIRKNNSKAKIIIYSAYDQFEYAKEAIRLNVLHYILKPVCVEEFIEVMNKVIKLCDEDAKREIDEKNIQENISKFKSYEKERILLDIVNGVKIDGDFILRMHQAGINFQNKAIKLILFEFSNKFFDKESSSFKNILRQFIKNEYEYVNLNEHQSVIFIPQNVTIGVDMDSMDICNDIKDKIIDLFDVQLCIVVGKWIYNIEDISHNFIGMEQATDYKFFLEGSAVLYYQENSVRIINSGENNDEVLKKIYKSIDINDYYSTEKWMEIYFDALKQNGKLSSIFVKYTSMDIAKKLIEKLNKESTQRINESAENIFRSNTLNELKKQIISLLFELKNENVNADEELSSKAVRDALQIIHENYMKDISLEFISEKVYISPGYLSNIFTKATGQSLIKYLTSYRLKKAKQLLNDTNMKIVDVAKSVGYLNVSYFCWVFKAYYQITPSKYRESMDKI